MAISFGGLTNDELAVSCTDPDRLQAAYGAVVDRYNVSSIDLDIEGEALSDTASLDRRSAAVAALQQERRKAGNDLSVWLTLPADPHGMTAAGNDAVRRMMTAGTDLAGVNVMTMDYGGSKLPGRSMYENAVAAAEATHVQLGSLYRDAGNELGSETVWRKIGLTPMIGQNDVVDEVFTLQDAQELSAYADTKGVGRLSMWSLNRDRTCSSNYPDVKKVSDGCSGVDQDDSSFATLLGAGVGPPRPYRRLRRSPPALPPSPTIRRPARTRCGPKISLTRVASGSSGTPMSTKPSGGPALTPRTTPYSRAPPPRGASSARYCPATGQLPSSPRRPAQRRHGSLPRSTARATGCSSRAASSKPSGGPRRTVPRRPCRARRSRRGASCAMKNC